MIMGLRRHDRLLNTGQQLLGLGQRQAELRDIAQGAGPADLQHVDAASLATSARLDQPQHPRHP
ncbi:MAG: hypothetical protein JO023_07210 [Chloroflexi bacterium]|nr:hypothetical protein [Chloroflexota bacterium]